MRTTYPDPSNKAKFVIEPETLAEYDSLRKVNPHRKELLDYLCEQTGWTSDDGPIQGVFSDKPGGSRCVWSCRWTTNALGMIHPVDVFQFPEMDSKQLIAELSDYVFTGNPFNAQAAGKLVVSYLNENWPGFPDPSWWLMEAERALDSCRTGAQEYAALWDVPLRIIGPLVPRPGYSIEPQLQEKFFALKGEGIKLS